MPRWFLGVDGGQSGMRALIADESCRVTGSGCVEGPSSPTDGPDGRGRFAAALRASVERAREAAGIASDTVFTAACMGFSGGAADKETLARSIVSAEAYAITHDAWIALNGATGGAPGVVVIAGTGSIAFGKNAAGATARVGGWGYAFGDEGSAFDLARQALRAALREEEGWGAATVLRPALMEAAGAPSIHDLLHRFYAGEISRAGVAALAPLVEDAALRRDAVAQELLGSAAQSLALLAGAARGKLFGERDPVDVRHSGGVFRCRRILERFRMLVEMDGRTSVGAAIYRADAGALLEALRLGGVEGALMNMPGAEAPVAG